jgi:hypothetical protein
MSPELERELATMPRPDRIALFAAALISDVPRRSAALWCLSCIAKLSDGLSGVERLAIAGMLHAEADAIEGENVTRFAARV